MFAFVPRWLPLALVGVLALWLRTHDLARRPMHSDEANQAVKFGQLLETGEYSFDPRDHHGPTLYYAAWPIAQLRGERTLAALTETTVRLVPALAGTLAVLLVAALASSLGRWPALAAAVLMAVSPPAVYYSRYFIQETLLVAFTLATFACVQRWWRSGGARWALAAGVCAGLMQATKATAPLFMILGAIALLAVRPPRPGSRRIGREFALAVTGAAAIAALLYTSFGTHPGGLRDAFEAYGFGAQRAASGAGHEKPWWYYLQLFAWRRDGGLLWEQLGFSALAVCGAGLALSRVAAGQPVSPTDAAPPTRGTQASRPAPGAARPASDHRAVASPGIGAPRRLLLGTLLYTVLLALVLSVTPYKTPWHAVHFVPGLAVLAAGALALLPRPSSAVALAVIVVGLQLSQTRLAVFLRPADPRNPYAYVHSSPDVLKIRALVDAALARDPVRPVRVIGGEYWPIPWYLRGLDRVGYWSMAPDRCDGALVIASGDQIDVVRSRLRQPYRESYLGLRPGVICVVFTPSP